MKLLIVELLRFRFRLHSGSLFRKREYEIDSAEKSSSLSVVLPSTTRSSIFLPYLILERSESGSPTIGGEDRKTLLLRERIGAELLYLVDLGSEQLSPG